MEAGNSKLKLLISDIVIESTEVINNLSGRVMIPEEYFSKNKEDFCMHETFWRLIYEPIKSIPISVPTLFLNKYGLNSEVCDYRICNKFGIITLNDYLTRAEILWIIMYLTAKQLHGEEGIIKPATSSTLIGYVRAWNVTRAVCIGRTNTKWVISCHIHGEGNFGEENELLICTNIKDIHLVH